MASASFSIAACAFSTLARGLSARTRRSPRGVALPSAIFLRIAAMRLTSAMRSGSSLSAGVSPGRPPVLEVEAGRLDRAVGPLDRAEPEHRAVGIGLHAGGQPRRRVAKVPLLQLRVAARRDSGTSTCPTSRWSRAPCARRPTGARSSRRRPSRPSTFDVRHVGDRQRARATEAYGPTAPSRRRTAGRTCRPCGRTAAARCRPATRCA